jgi:hypothetical protein
MRHRVSHGGRRYREATAPVRNTMPDHPSGDSFRDPPNARWGPDVNSSGKAARKQRGRNRRKPPTTGTTRPMSNPVVEDASRYRATFWLRVRFPAVVAGCLGHGDGLLHRRRFLQLEPLHPTALLRRFLVGVPGWLPVRGRFDGNARVAGRKRKPARIPARSITYFLPRTERVIGIQGQGLDIAQDRRQVIPVLVATRASRYWLACSSVVTFGMRRSFTNRS